MAYCGLMMRVGVSIGQRFLARATASICFHQSFSASASDLVLAGLPEMRSSRAAPWRHRRRCRRSTRTILLICEASISRWIFFELGRKGADLAGDAVVEARAQADHQVAIMHGVIGFARCRACPACPAIAAARPGKAPSPIRVEVMGKPVRSTSSRSSLLRFRAGIDDAAAGIEDRPLRRRHHLHRLARSPTGRDRSWAGRCGDGPTAAR